MTTVIGIQYDNKCTLFADSQVTDTNMPFKHSDMVKIAKHGQYLLSVSGDMFMVQFICYTWQPPVPTQEDLKHLFKFMVASVVPNLREELKEIDKLPTKDDEGEKVNEFNLLICLNGVIFLIDDDFSVTRSDTNFYGIGSGSSYALGALHAGAGPLKALEIAQKLDVNTSSPFIKREQRKSK